MPKKFNIPILWMKFDMIITKTYAKYKFLLIFNGWLEYDSSVIGFFVLRCMVHFMSLSECKPKD